jgi:hypothetical protein
MRAMLVIRRHDNQVITLDERNAEADYVCSLNLGPLWGVNAPVEGHSKKTIQCANGGCYVSQEVLSRRERIRRGSCGGCQFWLRGQLNTAA